MFQEFSRFFLRLCILFNSKFQDFFHLKKNGFFPFHLLYFYSIYTRPQSLIPSHLKYTQTKNDVIYLEPFNDTYLILSLFSHLFGTRMSWLRLWPRKRGLVFFTDWWWLVVLKLRSYVVGFVKAMISFGSLGVWEFGVGKP